MEFLERDGATFAISARDGEEKLANFTARITRQMNLHDADKVTTQLKIVGTTWDSTREEIVDLPMVTVTDKAFQQMNWVNPLWGYHLVISPTGSAAQKLKAAIQSFSRPVVDDIYTSTGWSKERFLTSSGALGANGLKTDQKVQLPTELTRYSLPNPPEPKVLRDALMASIRLAFIAQPEVAWPVLLACYQPTLHPTDFAIHIAGKTGTFKSELAALAIAHFGEFDSRTLPASWTSTGNALEALAYRAKDVLITIDDFIPVGTSWQVRQYAKVADQIFRGQGNQAGRSRLTDISSLQTTMYPRGMILSTGEDVPEGHSVRARILIIELSPGDITPQSLTKLQRERNKFRVAMAGWIQWLASHRQEARKKWSDIQHDYRERYLEIGHTRTPSAIASLLATGNMLMQFAMDSRTITTRQRDELVDEMTSAILLTGQNQEQYLMVQNPTQIFADTLREMLTSKLVHVNDINGGIPDQCELLGWAKEDTLSGIPTFKRYGKCIGWLNDDEVLLDSGVVFEAAKRHARGAITITKQTMFKRLRDEGMLTKTDATRQRNTVRVTCEGAIRTVISMAKEHLTEAPDE